MAQAGPSRTATLLAILAAALGYFVDAYDLILCNIVRVDSLRGLGVPESKLLDVGQIAIDVVERLAGFAAEGSEERAP
jgi:hypothetical protein